MPRALVIGGSVGGLFAARMLGEIGWDVSVYEKSAGDISGRGAGIGLTVELLEAMRHAGAKLDDAIGVPCTSLLQLGRNGEVLSRIDRPVTSGIWARVYQALRAAVPDGIVHPGRGLERVTQDEERVVAHFADGSTEAGDLLVGCDGVYSTVRRQFLPDVAPRYAGYVAWRGLVEERLLPAAARELLSQSLTYVFPPGEMCLSMPNPGRSDESWVGERGYYAIWYRPAPPARLRELMTDETGIDHGLTIPPPQIRRAEVEAMRRDAEALLPPSIAEVFLRTELPLLQPITDLEVSRMTFGRVALLGDAAFVARPHSAAGITKAALDASVLAEEVDASPDDLNAALAHYETRRIAFARSLVDYARQLGAAALATDHTRDTDWVMREYGAPHLVRDVEASALRPVGA